MSTMPQEAIEAAAKAEWARHGPSFPGGTWESEYPDYLNYLRAGAEAALEAAAPYLIRDARAELEEMQEWQNTVATRMPEHYEDDIAQEAIIDRWLDDLTDGTLIREARAAELEAAAEGLYRKSGDELMSDEVTQWPGMRRIGYAAGGVEARQWLRARAAAIRAGEA